MVNACMLIIEHLPVINLLKQAGENVFVVVRIDHRIDKPKFVFSHDFRVITVNIDATDVGLIFVLILYEMGLEERGVRCIMDITQEAIHSTRYRILQNVKNQIINQ